MPRQYIDIESPQHLKLKTDNSLTPGTDEVVIAVTYAGINRADLLQRAGLYPPPEDASPVMGLEVAGIVSAVGPGSRLRIGDRVCALVHGGGYATEAIARSDFCLKLEDNISFEQGAALPEALLTVWYNLIERAQLKAGERLLVHGGVSGIGSMAIQIAKHLGCEVVATAGNSEKMALCQQLGADHALDYRLSLTDQLQELSLMGSIDVVLDMVGGDMAQFNLDALAIDGRIACIGFMRGSQCQLDLIQLLMKRATMTGSTLRRLTVTEKSSCFVAVNEQVMPAIAAGTIQPVIDSIFPLKDALAAQDHMASGAHAGKILLDCQLQG